MEQKGPVCRGNRSKKKGTPAPTFFSSFLSQILAFLFAFENTSKLQHRKKKFLQ